MAKTARPKLQSPRLVVILGNPEDPDSWQDVEVQTIGRDMEMVETRFARDKRSPSDYPVSFQRWIGYYALKRTGAIEATLSPEDYELGLIETQTAGMSTVPPTDAEAGDGSA